MAASRQRSKARRKSARRDGQPHCGARKPNGEPCLWLKGQGTDHPGTGRCWKHGGTTPSGVQGAAREHVESMASPIPVTPGQAIQAALNQAAGQFAYATAMVGGLSEAQMFELTDAGAVPNRWVRLQHSIMDKVASYAKKAADMGVQERQINLAEAQTAMMGELLNRVMNRLELTPSQRKRVGPVIREELPALTMGAEEKVAA